MDTETAQPPQPQPEPAGAAADAPTDEPEDAGASIGGGWGADMMTAVRDTSGSSMRIEISDPRVSCALPSPAAPSSPFAG